MNAIRLAGTTDRPALENDSGKHPWEFGRVSRADVAHLRLLVIRLHPYVTLHQGKDLRARAHQLAGADLAFAHDSILRGGDSRVAQICLGQHQRSPLGAQIGVEQQFL